MSCMKGTLTLEVNEGTIKTFKVCITDLTVIPKYETWEIGPLAAAELGLSEDQRKGTILVQKDMNFEGYVTAEIE